METGKERWGKVYYPKQPNYPCTGFYYIRFITAAKMVSQK